MRLVLDEALVRALMTFAAGGNKIGLVDGRTGVRGRMNFVRIVTIPATGSFNISTQQTELGVEGVVIGGELVFVARAADGRGLHAEGGLCRLQNRMRRVAVGADGSLEIALCDAVTVGAGLVFVVDLGVAGAAGFWDICLVGRAVWILTTEDAVGTVTALAVGRNQQALFAQGKAVDRVHVVRIDAGEALLRRHRPIAMTLAAGLGNVERIDGRARIGLGKDLVCVAVAACAGMLL